MRFVMVATMAAATLALGGCAGYTKGMGEQNPVGRIAVAPLMTADGKAVGRATAREATGGLRITIDVTGLPAGTHGAHIHTIGKCDAPDFMSAGGHWNPGSTKHGSMNPAGPHEGDLPNLVVDNDGHGSVAITLPKGTLDGLLDADGSALVVHANMDDMMTDPSGNSGARIACGVFAVN
ncbi:MAG: superoxide dismutase family protein [Sphingomonas sp.]|nr:superoxide dismutase family protein [Sphingomonas sp.]